MAPKKRKNVAGSSSSSGFDATMFPSLAKSEAYVELFANRTVGSERQIDDSFKSTDEYVSIRARRWNFLYTFDIDEINVNWVREFYCNMTIQDTEFSTFVRGKDFVISPSVLATFVGIAEPAKWDYPLPPNQPLPRNLFHVFGTELVGARHPWATGTLSHGVLTPKYRFLNWFYSTNLEPRGHTATVNHQHGMALYYIGMGNPVNVPLMLYNVMVKIPSAPRNATLPFGVLITRFLLSKEVDWRQLDAVRKIRGPINRRSMQQSEAHIIEEDAEEDEVDAAEGEQDSVSDRLTRLENEVHALNDSFISLNATINTRFTSVDESLAAILARLEHP